MLVEKIYVMVEEPSMEAALEVLLPKMLRIGIAIDIRQFQCKNELLKRLPQRLKGYAQWLPLTSRILVIVDRDDDDCLALKSRLDTCARQAGLSTANHPIQNRVQVINRIAIEELEAWFFGDSAAVRSAYPRLDPNTTQKAAYRNSDTINGGTWEALERELQKRNYFTSGLRKSELSREVAGHMNPMRNSSTSFCALRDAVQAL